MLILSLRNKLKTKIKLYTYILDTFMKRNLSEEYNYE